MRLFLPPSPPGQAYLARLIQQLTDAFTNVMSSDQASPRLVLLSPDGRAWDVTIDNSGTLHTALNTGMINPAGGHPS